MATTAAGVMTITSTQQAHDAVQQTDMGPQMFASDENTSRKCSVHWSEPGAHGQNYCAKHDGI